MALHHLRASSRSLEARPSSAAWRIQGSRPLRARLAPCPLPGAEANPARGRAFARDCIPSTSLFNATRTEAFMSKLHRLLMGAVLGAGLAIGSGASAKELTLCWA